MLLIGSWSASRPRAVDRSAQCKGSTIFCNCFSPGSSEVWVWVFQEVDRTQAQRLTYYWWVLYSNPEDMLGRYPPSLRRKPARWPSSCPEADVLTRLTIKNVALVREVSIEFGPGLNVLTGETGAGKSILVEALQLVLGKRASTQMLRDGTDDALVEAVFVRQPHAEVWRQLDELLEPYELAGEDDLTLRRVLRRDGRNRVYIQGSLVPSSLLEELGPLLVDVASQFHGQKLLRREYQAWLLDRSGGLESALAVYRQGYRDLLSLRRQRQVLREEGESERRRREELGDKLRDLSTLGGDPGQFEMLRQEAHLLRDAEHIRMACFHAHERLYSGDKALYDQLAEVLRSLEELRGRAPQLEQAVVELEAVASILAEVGQQLGSFATSLEDGDQRLEQLENRLGALDAYLRRYRLRPEELQADTLATKAEFTALAEHDRALERLDHDLSQLEVLLLEQASRLHQQRLVAAPRLGAAINTILRSLRLERAELVIEVQAPADPTPDALGERGYSTVRLLFRSDLDLPLKPLDHVVSGGELSRLFLALKVLLGRHGESATILLDEVDTGVGGEVAEAIGLLLAELARELQVLVITHAPQLARHAVCHLLVEKLQREDGPCISVRNLDQVQRRAELARMLGGETLGRSVQELAGELLGRKEPGT